VCGHCRHCRAGRYNLCANTVGLGVNRDGAFAEQVVLPVTNVWHQWPGIDEEVAAIFDPFGNAVHTALSFPVLGEDVLVVGAGPDRADGGRRRPPRGSPLRRRQRAEPRPPRLALRMGATHVVDPTARTLGDVQAELGMVEGFDVVLEMSGNSGDAPRRARQHGPRRRDGDPRHPDRGDPRSTSARSSSTS
jgi:threonine 3-dehydrogenase